MELAQIHEEATAAAAKAAQAYLDKYGDGYPCGFSWVTVYDVKLSSKLGKEFAALGFRKGYHKGIELWNPSKNPTQNVDAKEAGATAYVQVLKKYFPAIKASVGSRLD